MAAVALVFAVFALLHGCVLLKMGSKSWNSGATAKKYAGPVSFHLENRTGAESITELHMAMVDDKEEGDSWIGLKAIPTGDRREWKVKPGVYRVLVRGSVITETQTIESYKARIDRLAILEPTRLVITTGPSPGGRVEKSSTGERIATVAVKLAQSQGSRNCQPRVATLPDGACPDDTFEMAGKCYWDVPAGCECSADHQCEGDLTCDVWSGGAPTCGSARGAEVTHVVSLEEPSGPPSASAPEGGDERRSGSAPTPSAPAPDPKAVAEIATGTVPIARLRLVDGDGRTLAETGADGSLWTTDRKQPFGKVEGGAIAFHASGEALALAKDGTLHLVRRGPKAPEVLGRVDAKGSFHDKESVTYQVLRNGKIQRIRGDKTRVLKAHFEGPVSERARVLAALLAAMFARS
jgi:hypothetical protein